MFIKQYIHTKSEIRSKSPTLYTNQFKLDEKTHYFKTRNIKTVKKKNIDKTLQDTGIGNKFLNRTPVAQKKIPKIDK